MVGSIYKHGLLLLLCFLPLLSLLGRVHGINLESTSYNVKTASLFGIDYKYAMFEAQFDEEVYMLGQWPCQCVNSTLPCAASPTTTNPPGINETVLNPNGVPYDMKLLQPNQWYKGAFYGTDINYFKIHVPYNSAMPCPIITIDLQSDFGAITSFVSTSAIPTQVDYEWTRTQVGFSTITICPSHPLFVYGNYYVLLGGGLTFTNTYSIRYTLQQSPTCSVINVNYTQIEQELNIPSTASPFTWLEDGVAETFPYPFNPADPGQGTIFYALYAPTPCSTFSLAFYPEIYFDSWLMMSASTTHPNPQYLWDPTSAEWFVFQSGMNTLNINTCNPDSSKNYTVLYIGFLSTFGMPTANQSYQVIATSQKYTPPTPLSSLGFTQFTLDMTFGSIPQLTCDTAVYTCWFPGGFECPVNQLPCCFPFFPVPPSETIQALWPWNVEDTSVTSFYLALNYTDVPPTVPGKLSFALFLEYTRGDTRQILAPEPTTCTLTVGNNLVDRNSAPLPVETITFTQTPLPCDYDKYKAIADELSMLKEEYLQVTNVADLAVNQVKMAIASWDNDYYGCASYIQQNLTNTTSQIEYAPAYLCPFLPGTAEWGNSACCNPSLLDMVSCHPTLVNESLPITGTYMADTTNQQCSNPECSQSTIQTWIQQQTYITNPTTGCTANLFAQASPDHFIDLTQFAIACKVQVEGATLLGAPCHTSADCFNNVACLPATSTCNSTYNDVLDCLAQNIDPLMAIVLLNSWGMSVEPTHSALVAAFEDHWVSHLCVGPKAERYRDGNTLVLLSPTCVDDCRARGLESYCPSQIFEGTPICPVPGTCSYGVNTNACFRTWIGIGNATTSCTEQLTCNWRTETYWPCLPDTLDDCSALCAGPSTNVCLDCSNNVLGSCLEVEAITDETRCNQGLCSAGFQITNATTCENSGNCSLSCPTCDTQSGCESSGQCSDILEFGPIMEQASAYFGAPVDGACLYSPLIWNGYYLSCGYFPTDFAFYGSIQTSIGCSAPWISYDLCYNLSLVVPQVSWYVPASNVTECNALPYGCYDPTVASLFTARSKQECDYCSYCTWKQIYTYSHATWTPGRVQQLQWQPRLMTRQNSVALAVDYTQLIQDVSYAITRVFSYAYYTEALCRYENVGELVKSILCDCSSSTSSQCFSNSGASPIGTFTVCPYQEITFGTLDASIAVSNTSVPTNQGSCPVISIGTTSVGKYQRPPDFSVSNQLFKEIQSNPYWIVENANGVVVGQVISNAVKLTIPFDPVDMLTLCIETETFINVAAEATLVLLGQLQTDNSIHVYANSMSFAANASAFTNGSRLSVCGKVNTNGTWFAVAVVPNYKDINPTPSAETIVAFCFYIIVIGLALIQLIIILIERESIKLLAFKVIALVIIMVNGSTRAVYILPPANAFVGSSIESIAFIIYELPTFLYFSVFTVITYLWAMVIVNTKSFGRGKFTDSRKLRNAFIAANIFMYFIFVVFIYLTAILPEKTQPSPCFLGNLDSASSKVERSIKIAYWIFQCVVSVLLCVTFLITALRLLQMVYSLRSGVLSSEKGGSVSAGRQDVVSVQLIIISTVAFVCVVFLLVRSIIFLVVAINDKSIQIMTFCMLEIIPQLMLLLYIRPPRFCVSAVAHATGATGITGRSLGGNLSSSNSPKGFSGRSSQTDSKNSK